VQWESGISLHIYKKRSELFPSNSLLRLVKSVGESLEVCRGVKICDFCFGLSELSLEGILEK
jgi:hypothetical protein